MPRGLRQRLAIDPRSLRDAWSSPAVWPAELFELLGRLQLLRSLRLCCTAGGLRGSEPRGTKLQPGLWVHKRRDTARL